MAHRFNVKTGMHRFLLAASLLLGSCTWLMDQSHYSAEAIEGWVVDEKTGASLEGVVVVANWVLMRGTVGGRSRIGSIKVLETVTEVNGRFSFPAWGPARNETAGFLDHEDPQLTFFKPGYLLKSLNNDYRIDLRDKPSTRKSDWNGQTIALRKFDGSEEKYADYLAISGNTLIVDFQWNRGCNIDKTPMLVRALHRENSRLASRGFRKGGFTLDRYPPDYLEKCAFPREGK